MLLNTQLFDELCCKKAATTSWVKTISCESLCMYLQLRCIQMQPAIHVNTPPPTEFCARIEDERMKHWWRLTAQKNSIRFLACHKTHVLGQRYRAQQCWGEYVVTSMRNLEVSGIAVGVRLSKRRIDSGVREVHGGMVFCLARSFLLLLGSNGLAAPFPWSDVWYVTPVLGFMWPKWGREIN